MDRVWVATWHQTAGIIWNNEGHAHTLVYQCTDGYRRTARRTVNRRGALLLSEGNDDEAGRTRSLGVVDVRNVPATTKGALVVVDDDEQTARLNKLSQTNYSLCIVLGELSSVVKRLVVFAC